MKLTTSVLKSRSGGRAVSAVGLALSIVLALPATGDAQVQIDKEAYYAQRSGARSESAFNLNAEATVILRGNQFQCGVRSDGPVCVDVFDSPTGGGGFWPTGSPNQYLFQAGLWVGGIFPDGEGLPESWVGDTVAAAFAIAHEHGTAITPVYNSQNDEDLANWPQPGDVENFPNVGAYVENDSLFTDVVLGRKVASQQDSWVVYWDGTPGNSTVEHPMGILVEQRSLAWTYPVGNEATVYFIWKFTNITNNPYFQRINEDFFFGGENALPDDGWTINNVYMAFAADPDVTTDYTSNHGTAILPFNMGIAYHAEFTSSGFIYPPELFHPPFFEQAPGLVGVKFLQGPIVDGEDLGLTLFSLFERTGIFPDPDATEQIWRYMSGNLLPGQGDPTCTFPNEVQQRRICYISQSEEDNRFYQASGPFSLAPGQSQTVVGAILAAATVEVPGIVPGSGNPPGIPTLQPGCSAIPSGDGVSGPVRPIEAAAGWASTPPSACPAGDEAVDQFDVEVVPGSLLGKALVAQSVFDNNFLLPFAPEAPEFQVIPGDGKVTITWQPSATEELGDPYIQATGDSTNALYNPNYRQFDVEGYRIYRGTTPANMEVIAQFDYGNTFFIDHICETDPTQIPDDGIPCTSVDTLPIVSPFVQYGPGDIVRLAGGEALVVAADTAVADEVANGNALPMTDTGMPENFTYVDTTVVNNFQYFYTVAAFDVNSLRSAPTSLESSTPPVSVYPQRPAGNVADVHTVPDPYYAVSLYDLNPHAKRLRFVNLPARATIRIYTVSGRLVDIVVHNDPEGGGMETWDLRNRSNQLVASGVYFFHVSTPSGAEHVGKFTIVNSGGLN